MSDTAALLPGTLDLLILKSVSLGRLHGYGVLLRIEQISGGDRPGHPLASRPLIGSSDGSLPNFARLL